MRWISETWRLTSKYKVRNTHKKVLAFSAWNPGSRIQGGIYLLYSASIRIWMSSIFISGVHLPGRSLSPDLYFSPPKWGWTFHTICQAIGCPRTRMSEGVKKRDTFQVVSVCPSLLHHVYSSAEKEARIYNNTSRVFCVYILTECLHTGDSRCGRSGPHRLPLRVQ